MTDSIEYPERGGQTIYVKQRYSEMVIAQSNTLTRDKTVFTSICQKCVKYKRKIIINEWQQGRVHY